MKESTKDVLRRLWAEVEAAPPPPTPEPYPLATAGKFKPRQMVEVCNNDTGLNAASCSIPEVGFRGMVVLGDKYTRYRVPAGKVAVRFSAKLMGYLDYLDRPFCVLFVQESALKAAA